MSTAFKYIAAAQVASDSGKNKSGLNDPLFKAVKNADRNIAFYALKCGYRAKDKLVRMAVAAINSEHPKDAHYYYGCDDYYHTVIYFDLRIEGQKWQVSFHLPYNKDADRMRRIAPNSCKTVWDKKNSYEACLHAMNSFKER